MRLQRALTAGATAPGGAPRGTTTWAEWLARRDVPRRDAARREVPRRAGLRLAA